VTRPRLLGLDYGARRIGVALSDEGRRLARPHSLLHHRGWTPSARAVEDLLKQLDAEYVVLGLPYGMDDQVGSQAQEVLGFAEALRRRGIRVEMQDERLTSLEAGDILREQGHTWQRSKALVDQVAAALILQAYLDQTPHTP